MFIKDLVLLRHYNVILENSDITTRPWQRLAISDNLNRLMRERDMKHIVFKHQRENKQNSDKGLYQCKETTFEKYSLSIMFDKNINRWSPNKGIVFKNKQPM